MLLNVSSPELPDVFMCGQLQCAHGHAANPHFRVEKSLGRIVHAHEVDVAACEARVPLHQPDEVPLDINVALAHHLYADVVPT